MDSNYGYILVQRMSLWVVHTAKNIPDSRSIRETHICMVPTYLLPSNTVISSIRYQLYMGQPVEGQGDALILDRGSR